MSDKVVREPWCGACLVAVLWPEKRGQRLRKSRADAHFSRHELPGREEVHKARGVWMSCVLPEAAAGAELAQAPGGCESRAPRDERQHFLVQPSRPCSPPSAATGLCRVRASEEDNQEKEPE